MAIETILDECVTVASGIAGIGIVRKYVSLDFSESGFIAKFTTGGIVNALEISLRSIDPTQVANKLTQYTHEVIFDLWYGINLDDEETSAETFRGLIDAILDEFRPLYRLNGVARHAERIAVESVVQEPKSGALCHHAVMILSVLEDRQG